MPKYKATLSLDLKLWTRFQGVCALERTTASKEMESLIRQWLTQHEPKAAAAMMASSRPKKPLP